MNHIVFLDTKSKELDQLLSGKKTMIVRGSMSKKTPYKQVDLGDVLLFADQKENTIKGKAKVIDTYFSTKLNWEESFQLVDKYQNKLKLNTALKKRCAGKQYISLITIDKFEPYHLSPAFNIHKTGKSEDWRILARSEESLLEESV